MVSMESVQRDHTYCAALGKNPRGSNFPTTANIASYLISTLDDAFSIQHISLPDFNWLVITNTHQVVKCPSSGVIHTARILVEEKKDDGSIRASFQVLFKTHTEFKVRKPTDIDDLVSYIGQHS